MSPLILVGASKFALEVARYIEDQMGHQEGARQVAGYRSLPGEDTVTPLEITRELSLDDIENEVGLVLASADLVQREDFLSRLDVDLRSRFVSVIHPTATVPVGTRLDSGVIIGPNCHIGVNVRIGAFTVLNYLLSIGHHSMVGENNFLSPGFHCGNSVEMGDHNMFGVACTVGPGVQIGSSNRFQAGSLILENVRDRLVGIPSQRTKFITQQR